MLPTHPDRLTDTEFDQWIRRLVDTAEPEGTLLDYKREINASKQSDRRELAKDVASFANEVGGTIIYGIPEQQGQPQAAPVPVRPYGIDPVPGLEQNLENILSTTIAPLLPEYRIRRVDLSEYPGKFCYVVWAPESWAGPHMVHGYRDGRFYRRGQFRSVIMSERDVEERYRRRLLMRNAADQFVESEDALYLDRFYQHNQATTILMVVPLMLIPNRVVFTEPRLREWLLKHALYQGWKPSMQGVRTCRDWGAPGDRTDVELHHNGALVAWRYTEADIEQQAIKIASVPELDESGRILELAASFYQHIEYAGPLTIHLTVHCLPNHTLHLSTHRSKSLPLEPRDTNLRMRIEPSAAQLIADIKAVKDDLADEFCRAFGMWEAR